MRLVTWNCRMALDRKREAVRRLGADVLVVPECARGSALALEPGVSFAWRGDHANKGLGIFGLNGWRVSALPEEDPLPWALPVAVADPAGEPAFTLVAVWTGRPGYDGRPGYPAQVAAVIGRWASSLAAGRVVLAGDFNCSAQGPAIAAHRANVALLESLGVHSAYHAHTGLEHGAELAMSLRWVGPGRAISTYHCDFVFVPQRLLGSIASVDVGDASEWIDSRLSDHAPITVILDA
jgi:hypothetical protein